MRTTRSVLLTLVCGLALLASVFAVDNPNVLRFPTNVYAKWQGYVLQGNSATGSQTILVQVVGISNGGGSQLVNPFSGPGFVPLIVDTESVTPTAVSCGISPPTGVNVPNQAQLCNVTATFTAVHGNNSPVSSGDSGLQEALNDACALGGLVVLDGSSNVSNAQLAAATGCGNADIEDLRLGTPTYYTLTPTTLTALATPATRSATAGTTQVISGTATGTWAASAYFVCVTYVDALGGESPCSASFSFTATASVALNYASPAASTGAVGWRAYAGLTGTSTQYQLPISSTTCTLSTSTPYPTCAIGAAGVFPTPTTATMLAPGYVVNTYRPNTQSHTTLAYQPSAAANSGCSPQANYGPFIATAGGTTTQIQVLGTVQLNSNCLNYIGRTIRVSGRIAMTNGTSETPDYKIQLGPTFTTGTPTTICDIKDTTALTAAANGATFSCTMTVNATGASGTVMPNGWSITQLQAGTTAGAGAVDVATAAITDALNTQNTLYVTYVGTGGTSTAAQLLQLSIEEL